MIATNHKSAGGANRKCVLALGGGGARGLAHLGVIERMPEHGLTVERIIGVSIGSLAGALYAADPDILNVQRRISGYLTSEQFCSRQAALCSAAPAAEEPSTSGLFAWYGQIRKYLGLRQRLVQLFNRPSLLTAQFMSDIVNSLLPDIDLQDTKIPLSVVALDLITGKRVVLTEGSLRQAVMASAAIPGVFPTVQWDQMQLCDIGMMDALPSRIAAACATDLTVAVDVGGLLDVVPERVTAADIFLRLSDIGEHLVREYTVELADLVVRPDVARIPWFDFSDPESTIQKGRDAAESAFPAIPEKHTALIGLSERLPARLGPVVDHMAIRRIGGPETSSSV